MPEIATGTFTVLCIDVIDRTTAATRLADILKRGGDFVFGIEGLARACHGLRMPSDAWSHAVAPRAADRINGRCLQHADGRWNFSNERMTRGVLQNLPRRSARLTQRHRSNEGVKVRGDSPRRLRLCIDSVCSSMKIE